MVKSKIGALQAKSEMATIVIQTWVGLLYLLTSWIAVPDSGPRLVRPTETEWKNRFATDQNVIRWSLE
jgi:hypothetical protein